jgi:hypothetical protein
MTNIKSNKTTQHGARQYGSKKCQIADPEPTLITAGGRIKCRRCAGISSRTKKQCKHPALKTSKASRCKWHAGASTGPRTKKGIEAIRKANTIFGSFTKEAMAERKRKFAELNEIAKILFST